MPNLHTRIIINGGEVHTSSKTISYEVLAFLAGYDIAEEGLTMTYRTRRPEGDEQRSGTLTSGQATDLENGMVFNVARI